MKKTPALFFMLFFACHVFCQTDIQIRRENYNENLHICTLENGLTVFIEEDSNSALTHVELCVKAGFSKQNAHNTGFIPLYTRLFTQGSTASCNADSATFIKDVSPLALSSHLKELSECLKAPNFTDKAIRKEFENLKEESKNYAESSTGFINSAIDSRVFSESPWKQDSGIYPSLFSSYKISECRAILKSIGKTLYTPENSALFITGPLEADKVLTIVEEHFSSWSSTKKNTYITPVIKNNKDKSSQKKYVLTASWFPKDMTQIIIQFTTLSMSQADILAAAFNDSFSEYKKNTTQEITLGIRSRDYVNAASAQKNGSSRFILQALLEETDLQDTALSPALKTERFLEITKKSARLSRSAFVKAQEEVNYKYRTLSSESKKAMELLADFWALNDEKDPLEFYTHFLDLAHNVQGQNENLIYNLIEKEEPFVFVLINDAVYRKSEEDFTSLGYELITEANASWYKDKTLSLIAQNEAKKVLSKDEEELKNLIQDEVIREQDKYYFLNSKKIKSFTLSNGIPLAARENRGSQTVVISLGIEGGEASSPSDQRQLRTMLINAFAKNIKNLLQKTKTSIKAWTEETVSFITVECVSEDTEKVLQAVTDAVVYGEVSPVTADTLASELSYQWSMKNIFLDTQLRSNALSYLYRGTSFGSQFSSTESILQKTTYMSVNEAYTQLLDASLYSLVITGDIAAEKAFNISEKTLGILKEQSIRETYQSPMPQFKNKTRAVQLSHQFVSDLDPSLTINDSPLLIPTKDFYDPVQLYFLSPEGNEKELFNAVLYTLNERIQSRLGEEKPCKAIKSTDSVKVGMLEAQKILHRSDFINAYKASRKELYNELEEAIKSNDDSVLINIKALWEEKELALTQSNEGTARLMHEGLRMDRPTNYLDSYLLIENADATAFFKILSYIPEECEFTVYSVDSKK